jgi:hypothetical protein
MKSNDTITKLLTWFLVCGQRGWSLDIWI